MAVKKYHKTNKTSKIYEWSFEFNEFKSQWNWLDLSHWDLYQKFPDSEDILCRRKLIASPYLHGVVVFDNMLNGMLLITQNTGHV